MLGPGHAPRVTESGGSNGVESGQCGRADAASFVSKMVAVRLTAKEKGHLDSLCKAANGRRLASLKRATLLRQTVCAVGSLGRCTTGIASVVTGLMD